MFFGSYEYNIDDKGRIVIPSKMRQDIGEKLYLLKGFDGCISIYKEEDFHKFIENVRALPYEKSKVRAFLRMILSSAVELNVDRQWRLLIPRNTLNEYHIESKVMIIGQIDHIEIWNLDSWNAYKADKDQEFEINAEGLFDFNEK